MGLSDKLASLNFDRYQSWKASKTLSDDAKPSVLVFKGDVYQGLSADTFNTKQLKFSQKHLRILSGLYGILKPMDLIKPYRLEMGTKLVTDKGKNLYEFWGNAIQKNIINELDEQKSDLVINLASKEYFSVIGKMPEHLNVVSPAFRDFKNGKYKIISFYAKRARGLMARWIIENNIKDFERLSEFNVDGYYYSSKESSVNEPVFLRD
jgi:cytoplasmic iron level regulating protein YaaA (DUF328/UPF0246 family)